MINEKGIISGSISEISGPVLNLEDKLENINLGNGIGIALTNSNLYGNNKIEIANIKNIGGEIKGNIDKLGTATKNINLGNGIGLYTEVGKINIENIVNEKGIISSYIKELDLGNGIGIGNGISIVSNDLKRIDQSFLTIGKISNGGTITGKVGTIKYLNSREAFHLGNGIALLGNFEIDEIKNTGIISGHVDDACSDKIQFLGNGIAFQGITGIIKKDIINTGDIIGSIESIKEKESIKESNDNAGFIKYSGNGMIINSAPDKDLNIGNINNAGNIIGEIKGATKNTEFETLGNGLSIEGKFKFNVLNNTGKIKGKFISDNDKIRLIKVGNGTGLWPFSFSEDSTIHRSFKMETKINEINNEGLIYGEIKNRKDQEASDLELFYSGNGVIFLTSDEFWDKGSEIIGKKIEKIENTGVVKGISEGNMLGGRVIGNGFSLFNDMLQLKNFNNAGYISGKVNKINSGFEIGWSGNGTFFLGGQFFQENFNNIGVINGKVKNANADGEGVGNGVALQSEGDLVNIGLTLNNFNNNGKITGVIEEVGNCKKQAVGMGSGVSFHGADVNIIKFNNKGVISGKIGSADIAFKLAENERDRKCNMGNGIVVYNQEIAKDELKNNIKIDSLRNNGVVSGYYGNLTLKNENDKKDVVLGNGIAVIADYENLLSPGEHGNEVRIKSFENIGTIIGKESGLYFYSCSEKKNNQKFEDFIENYNNYGLMIGQNPLKIENEKGDIKYQDPDNPEYTNEKVADKGYAIVLDENTNVKGVVGIEGESKNKYSLDIFDNGENKEYSILNTTKQNNTDAYQEFNDKNLTNTIINGVGENSGVVTVKGSSSLENGIVNAYKTAVTIGDNSEFTGTNVIINGGGLRGSDGETEIIKGTEGKNTLTLAGNVQLNGSIDLLGAGDSDTFNFGKAGAGAQVNIYDEIKNVENINATNRSNITLYETSKITGTDKLTIEAGSQVTLRVDSSIEEKNEKGEGINIYKNHALYNDIKNDTLTISGDLRKLNDGTIIEEKENGIYDNVSALNIKTNGLGVNSTIALGNVKFNPKDEENKIPNDKFTQNDTIVWVKTNSILHGAKVNETKLDNGKYDTNITIKAEKDLFSIADKITPPVDPDKPIDPDKPVNPKPDKPNGSDKYGDLYIKLNEVYKGIHTSNDRNFNALNDIVTNYTFGDKDKSDYPVVGNEKMQMATLLGYLRSVYSETPYSFSNESTRKSMELFHDTVRDNNFKAKEDEWLIYGGLVHQSGDQEQTYYGRNYHGFDTGTADTDAEIKLTGAYGQFEYGNTDTLSTGIMVGGTKSDVEAASSKLKGTGAYVGVYAKKDIKDLRLTAGAGYQYTEYDGTRRTINQTYSEDYKDNAFNLYLDGKYSYDLGNNLYLVPKAGLSYTHIDQDGIKESNDKALALNIDSKEFDVLEGTVGVDIKKVIPTEKGKHSVSAGVSYRHILDGADADYLTADFGGQDFEILVPHKNKGQMSIGVRYEAELENGMFYDVKGNYFMNVDSKENTHKNADRGEWRVGVGIGYKFTTLKELALTSLFDFDKSEIRPEGKEMLKNIATKLNGRADGTLVIEGHTDSVGSEKYNQTLSEKRAEAVEKELKANVTNKKVDYSTKGYGETKPIADNNTVEGRTENRRVELKFNKR